MTEPVAYMWKTERGTIIGFTPNDNSHSGRRLGIPLYTAEQLHPMKWFVRVDSQIPLPDENIYLDDELIVYPHYDSPKSSAHQFDTKEEAEKWTNPLTEAVQLPVEGE